uniref:Uncharacterized protein n=1 Tax=Anguilla anguilla TaxID=7936 RepID=A0A0E9X6P9_ANGAN
MKPGAFRMHPGHLLHQNVPMFSQNESEWQRQCIGSITAPERGQPYRERSYNKALVAMLIVISWLDSLNLSGPFLHYTAMRLQCCQSH